MNLVHIEHKEIYIVQEHKNIGMTLKHVKHYTFVCVQTDLLRHVAFKKETNTLLSIVQVKKITIMSIVFRTKVTRTVYRRSNK